MIHWPHCLLLLGTELDDVVPSYMHLSTAMWLSPTPTTTMGQEYKDAATSKLSSLKLLRCTLHFFPLLPPCYRQAL